MQGIMISNLKIISQRILLPHHCTSFSRVLGMFMILMFVSTQSQAESLLVAQASLTTAINNHAINTQQSNLILYALIASLLIILILALLLSLSRLKLRSLRSENNLIFNSLSSLIAIVDNDIRIVKFKQSHIGLLPLNSKNTVGKTAYDIFDKELADLMNSIISNCFKTKETIDFEYTVQHKGREKFFYAYVVYHSPTRAVFSAFDITDMKRREERLKESADKVQEMNETKDRFFSIIAHDLRSPVGSFKMLTGILLKNFGKNDPEHTKKVLSSIHLASSNLYDLLENLLSWSHSQRRSLSLNRQNQSLFNLVDDAIDSQLVHSELKQIEIINEMPPECFAVCDQYVTLTVIRNLISNAIKFTPKGGTIRIYCERVAKNKRLYSKVSVTDTGIGIPEDKLETIFLFNPNKSTIGTNNETGSGLGLILCQELIEKQDGFIEVESEVNEGTTISFYIPTIAIIKQKTTEQEPVFLS